MYVLLLTVLCKLVSSCNILPSFTQNSVGVFLQQSALSKIHCRHLISCDELHLVHPVNCLQPKTGCGIITVGILTALEIIVIGNWMYNNYCLINVGLIYGAFATLRKAIVSFIMYVCLSVCLSPWNNSVSKRRIFLKFYICLFLENLSRIFKFH